MTLQQVPGATPSDETPPFLDVDPPHWAAQGVAYVLILLFVTTAVASVIVHVPETVSGPFVLIPAIGSDPLRAPRRGIVIEMRATEGASVIKGEPMFVIESPEIGDRSAELRTLRTQVKGLGENLTSVQGRHESQRLTDQQEARRLEGRIAYLTRTIELKKKQFTLATELADRYKQAYAEGLMPWVDSSKPQLDADGLAAEVGGLETDLEDARSERERLRHETALRAAEYRELERNPNEEMEKNTIRIQALERELTEAHDDRLLIRAPCSGRILRLRVQAPGAVVQEGETFADLTCSNQLLQAEVTLPHSGVGQVRAGYGVKLRYEPFPYQRYGARSGTVRWISAASVTTGDTPGFRALVDIDQTPITVNGQPAMLLPGMRGTADVVVGRRSLISYAFEPLRQLNESLAGAEAVKPK